MSDSPAESIPNPPPAAPSAVLVLDETGHVHLANRAAARLCGQSSAALRGTAFIALFEFEVVSEDPDFAAAQWDAVLAGATSPGGLRLDLRSPDRDDENPPPPQPVRVRCEPGGNPGDGWIVTLAPELPARPSNAASHHSSSPFATAAADSPAAAFTPLLEHGTLGVFDLDFACHTVRYSSGWKRQLGYAPADLADTYDTWQQLIHPEDSAASPDQIGRRPAGHHRSFDLEYRLRHRHGHWVWLHGTGVQLFSADGKLTRVVGVQLDISERKELEDAAILAEERWRALVGEGPLAAFEINFPAHEAWVSPAFLSLVGGSAAPATPAAWAALLPDFATAGLAASLGDAADAEGVFALPATLQPPGRAAQPVLLAGACQRRRRGELYRAIGYIAPAPARPGAADPAADFLRLASDTLQEAIILTDARGQVLSLNAAAARLTGATLEVARNAGLNHVFRLVNAADGRPADDALEIALATEEAPRLTLGHALAPLDGRAPIPIVWQAHHLRPAPNQLQGLALVFRDPQEMNLTPEELIKVNRFDSLGLLAGAIAHDFNNLLTTVLGGISQAKDNRDYANLADAEDACMAAKGLTRQLLAFAKGSPPGALAVAKPAEILRDAIRVAASGSPVHIHAELEEECGPVEVDKGQMIQVFQNLIVNAVQAMPDPERGHIWVRCRSIALTADLVPPLAAGNYVQFDVQDNGAGISPENIDRIFEPFFTTKKTGTGLGLATVLSIVRKHGGQLGVDSIVGQGTTFTLFLPVTTRTIQVEARKAATLRFGTGRILFMDDDPKISEITAGMLKSLEYECDLARHGEEALALYRKYLNVNRPYDVVIMDLTIVGGMGGEACYHELRKLDPEVRAIIASGYDNDEIVERFLGMGFCGYLTKPYRVGDLSRLLKTVLGG